MSDDSAAAPKSKALSRELGIALASVMIGGLLGIAGSVKVAYLGEQLAREQRREEMRQKAYFKLCGIEVPDCSAKLQHLQASFHQRFIDAIRFDKSEPPSARTRTQH